MPERVRAEVSPAVLPPSTETMNVNPTPWRNRAAPWNQGVGRSVGDYSSIHGDGSTGHVRRICRRDKGDHMSDLLRFCQTLDGYRRNERRFIFSCVGEACEHTRIGSARSDYVDPNSAPCHFQRCGLGHSFHRMFAGYINGCSGSTDASIGRRDVDDAPAPLWQHDPQFVLHAEQHAEHIGVEGVGVALYGLSDDQAPLALGAGIVDGGVDPAEPGYGLIDPLPHLILPPTSAPAEPPFAPHPAQSTL